jgi:hypothetical protein
VPAQVGQRYGIPDSYAQQVMGPTSSSPTFRCCYSPQPHDQPSVADLLVSDATQPEEQAVQGRQSSAVASSAWDITYTPWAAASAPGDDTSMMPSLMSSQDDGDEVDDGAGMYNSGIKTAEVLLSALQEAAAAAEEVPAERRYHLSQRWWKMLPELDADQLATSLELLLGHLQHVPPPLRTAVAFTQARQVLPSTPHKQQQLLAGFLPVASQLPMSDMLSLLQHLVQQQQDFFHSPQQQQEQLQWSMASLQRLRDTLAALLEGIQLDQLLQQQPGQLARMALHLRQLQLQPSPLLAQHLLQAAQQQFPRFRASSYSLLLSSLSKLRVQPPGAWLEDCQASMLPHLPAFDPTSLAHTVMALSDMGFLPSDQWRSTFLSTVEQQLPAFRGIQLSMTLLGAARMHVSALEVQQGSVGSSGVSSSSSVEAGDLSSDALAGISNSSMDSSSSMQGATGQDSSIRDSSTFSDTNLSGASASLHHPHTGRITPSWLDASTHQLRRLTPSLQPPDITRSLQALACLHHPPQGLLLAALQQRIIHTADSFQPKELNIVIQSFAALQLKPDQHTAAALLEASQRLLPRYNTQELANTLLAVAQLQLKPSWQWMHCLLVASQQLLDTCSAADLCGLAKGFALLQYCPHPLWMQSYLQRLHQLLPAATPVEIAGISWALAKVGCQPASHIVQRLYRRMHRQLDGLSDALLCKVLWAASRFECQLDEEWWSCCDQELRRRAGRLDSQAVALVMYSMSGYSQRHPGQQLLQRLTKVVLVSRMQELLPRFSTHGLAVALLGLSRMTWPVGAPAAVAVWEEVQHRLGSMGSDELSLVAIAAANFSKAAKAAAGKAPGEAEAAAAAAPEADLEGAGLHRLAGLQACSSDTSTAAVHDDPATAAPPSAWLASFYATLQQQLPSLQPDDISHILCACTSFPDPPPRSLVPAALAALQQHMPAASSYSLAFSLRAAVRLGQPPDKEWLAALLLATHRSSGRIPLGALLHLMYGLLDMQVSPGG